MDYSRNGLFKNEKQNCGTEISREIYLIVDNLNGKKASSSKRSFYITREYAPFDINLIEIGTKEEWK